MLGYQYKLNKTDKEFILLDGKYEIGKTIFRNMSEPESIVGYQVVITSYSIHYTKLYDHHYRNGFEVIGNIYENSELLK